MMPCQLCRADRPKSATEMQYTDMQLGQFAATMARRWQRVTRITRAMFPTRAA